MSRSLVVVDVETTGLDVEKHIVLEVAAINVSTGEEFYFVPWVRNSELSQAEPEALSINRYYERRVYVNMLSPRGASEAWRKVASMLNGNTLGGSNPTFDASMIGKRFDNYKLRHGWHHRLADLAAYAAGKLDLPPDELPGLAKVCELLGITNESEHSALGDARATAECFRKLQQIGNLWIKDSVNADN